MSHHQPLITSNQTDEYSIVIIDDETDLLFVYKKALELHGFKVITFDDSLIALEEIKKHYKKYLVVMVDIRMPKVNGYQVINEIKRIDPYIKTVLMSAHDISEHELLHNLNASIKPDEVMHKPFPLMKLINTVSTLLKKNRDCVDIFSVKDNI